ncbi:hypothetical protein OROGR_022177 [Orobanche gracilis]
MAACGGLERIFGKPLPENQTFLESLSPWTRKSSADQSALTEIFGELHFEENNNIHIDDVHDASSPFSSLSSGSTSPAFQVQRGIDIHKKDENRVANKNYTSGYNRPSGRKKPYKRIDSFSSMNSESLSVCTEGLGFESFGDVEDLVKKDPVCNNNNNKFDEGQFKEERSSWARNIKTSDQNHHHHRHQKSDYLQRSRICRGDFPPPISCVGRSGKPWVCFKSYRQDGRFILKEIRIPTHEFLHACREDGRLRLQFIHSDDEIFEEEDDIDYRYREDDNNKHTTE